MPRDFNEMKKNRAAQFENLTKKIESKGGFTKPEADPTEWKLSKDKDTGIGSAVIRFLPASPNDEDPYVIVYSYSFQGPTGRYYIEDSLKTLGPKTPDPVSERNAALYKSGVTDTPRRKTSYWANILVIDDPFRPECNGNVYKFKFGPQIFGFLKAVMSPEDPEDPKFDPFDFWDGANFRLKISNKTVTVNGKKSTIPTYEKSKLESPSALFDGDKDQEAKIKAVWESEYTLSEILDPSRFKTYDELKQRLMHVLDEASDVSSLVEREKPLSVDRPANNKRASAPEPEAESSSDDDDGLSWFNDLKDLDTSEGDDEIPF